MPTLVVMDIKSCIMPRQYSMLVQGLGLAVRMFDAGAVWRRFENLTQKGKRALKTDGSDALLAPSCFQQVVCGHLREIDARASWKQ